MKGDTAVLDHLNRALRHELTASSQFWLHYRLLENWGFGKMARTWRKESIEEMIHADQLIARIIFLEGRPDLQHVEPLIIGETPREVLDCDLRVEYAARALYRQARDAAEAADDHVTRILFEELIEAEEEHVDFLETELDLHDRIGAERYGLLNAASADQSE
jgi:bacterioferritin